MNKWVVLVLTVIILIGFTIRTWRLADNPVSIYWDETAMGYDAYSVTQAGKDMHGNHWYQTIFPSYGDYKLPLYIWFTSIFTELVGPTVAALRLSSALAGTFLILVTYFIVKEIIKHRVTALLSAVVISILPWSVHFSRVAFEANLAALMVAICVLCLVYGLRKPWLLALAGVFGGLGVYGYFSVRFVIPPLIVGFGMIYFRALSRSSWIYLLTGLVLFAVMLLPIYRSPLYTAANQFRLSTHSVLNTDDHILEQNKNRELAGNTLISRLVYHRHLFMARRLAVHMSQHLSLPYLFYWGDSNLRHGTGEVGLGTLALLPLFFFGWYGLWRWYRQGALLLLLLWLVSLLPASVPLTVPHALRSLNAVTVMGIVVGVGMYVLVFKSGRKRHEYMSITLGALVALGFGLYWHDYWTHYPARSAEDWSYSLNSTGKLVSSNLNRFDTINVSSADDRLFLYVLYHRLILPESSWKKKEYRYQEYGNIDTQPIHDQLITTLGDGEALLLTATEYERNFRYVVTKQIMGVSKFFGEDGKAAYYLLRNADE